MNPDRSNYRIAAAPEYAPAPAIFSDPNPFGLIDLVGINGIFIIEMVSDECTNYEWFTVVDLNLAFWDCQTEQAEFTKVLHCPPP